MRGSVTLRSNTSGKNVATQSNRAEWVKGVFAPITTPYTAQNTLNFKKLEENIAIWGETFSLDGICALGSNGEFPLLTFSEKKDLLSCIGQVSHRVISFTHVTTNRR
jgi:dihydrodipicolinate synthase/N-acetylneuraminate lyase